MGYMPVTGAVIVDARLVCIPTQSVGTRAKIQSVIFFLIITESGEDIFIVRSRCQIFVKAVKKRNISPVSYGSIPKKLLNPPCKVTLVSRRRVDYLCLP
ncbi:MAG: hypothetical protein B1H11_07200 [Desulfobacteraceae bacterium 4484_190.1]|nr:MAG: hypothetical protein B1H11_07200 [Desulfobacteraceae bacterium 4484_190.1]